MRRGGDGRAVGCIIGCQARESGGLVTMESGSMFGPGVQVAGGKKLELKGKMAKGAGLGIGRGGAGGQMGTLGSVDCAPAAAASSVLFFCFQDG